MRDTGRLSVEFIVLVALLNAMVAMSIDTMLPPSHHRHGTGCRRPNDRQFIITTFFAGMTIGTLIYGRGPIRSAQAHDRIGLTIYVLARSSACSRSASHDPARTLHPGLRASAPRIVSSPWCATGRRCGHGARHVLCDDGVHAGADAGALDRHAGAARRELAGDLPGLLVVGVLAGLWLWLRQEETLRRSGARRWR